MIKLVFFGTPQFAVPSLQRLIQDPSFEVAAVVTQPDKRRGRGSDVIPSPVKAIAVEHGIAVWQPKRVKKDAETLAQLRSLQADAFVVVAYGQLLSQEILEMPRLGCVNAHGSLLPKYRGAAPIQWSLYHGEASTGITTMLMDIGMDTGAMLLKSETPIALLDNALDLAKTLSQQSADLLVQTLTGLDRQILEPIPQNEAEATYAPLIQKSDYELDWSRPAIALHNQVRGFYPNCTTSFRGQGLKITRTVPIAPDLLASGIDSDLQAAIADLAIDPSSPPGAIVGILKQQGAVVQTGEGLLLLREVQLAGKRSQSGWDFANGSRLMVGEKLIAVG